MMNVALMQYAVEATRELTYEKVQSILDKTLDKQVNYLLMPELFSTHYFCQDQDQANFKKAQSIDGSDVDFLKNISIKFGVFLSTSFFEKQIDGIYYNTAVTISPQGKVISLYRKSHIPQDPCFEEKYYFKPGDQLPKIIDVAGIKTATAVCWDQWFPELARCLTLRGSQLINYPTAIAWLKGEEETFHEQLNAWLTVTRSHAISNGLFVSCVNRVGTEKDLQFWGHSHLTAPTGKSIIEFTKDEEGVKCAQVDLKLIEQSRTAWPFLRDRRPDLYHDLVSASDI